MTETSSTNSSALVSNNNNDNGNVPNQTLPVRTTTSKIPDPQGWPNGADIWRAGQLAAQNEIDFLELQKTDLRTYVKVLLSMLPIPLQFKGLTLLPGFKFAIVRANTTLTLINFYAQQVGDCPECKTYHLSEFFNHIYCVLTKSMTPGKPSYVAAMQACETYRNNPVEAISCVFRYRNKDVAIPLSRLINDSVVEGIKKWEKPLKKEDISQFKESLLLIDKSPETLPIEPLVVTGGTGASVGSVVAKSTSSEGPKIQTTAVDNKKQKRQSVPDKPDSETTTASRSSTLGTSKIQEFKQPTGEAQSATRIAKNEESGSEPESFSGRSTGSRHSVGSNDSHRSSSHATKKDLSLEIQSEEDNESGDSDGARSNEQPAPVPKSADKVAAEPKPRKRSKTQSEESGTSSDKKKLSTSTPTDTHADRDSNSVAEPTKRKKKTQTTLDPSSGQATGGKRKRNSTPTSSVADDPGSPKKSSSKSSSVVGSSTPTSSAKKSKSSASSPLSSLSIDLKIDEVDPVVSSEVGNAVFRIMSGLFNYPLAATPVILKTISMVSEKVRNMPCFASSAKPSQQATVSPDDAA